jgi:gluconolactonase
MEIRRLSPESSKVLADDASAERAATGFRFTEGPLWDPRPGVLLFSDIPANRIYRWSEGGGADVFREPSGKSNGLTWDRTGALLACEHLHRRVSRTTPDGSAVSLVESYQGRRLNSPNDLVVRSDGAVYFTDPPYGILNDDIGAVADQEQPVNGLYLLRPGETEPVLLAEGFDRPNGLAFTPDESRLYVADTSRYRIHLFDVQPDGTLANDRIFAEFDAADGEGRPDGMKVDVAGDLFTTGPGGLWVLAPDGSRLAHVRLPEKAANCAWGGPDLRTLYICASTSLYRLPVRLPGIPAFPRSP